MFNPQDYIEPTERGYLLCKNPVEDGGLASITLNPRVNEDRMKHFQETVKRLVLNKICNPKFAEVLLAAAEYPTSPSTS